MGCDDVEMPDYDSRLYLQQFRSGAIQLAKCPTCLALVVEEDLDVHLQRAHAGVRIPPN